MTERARRMREAVVKIAPPYDDALIAKINAGASRLVGRNVRLRVKEDESLLGGFVLYLDGKIYDVSCKAQLEQMRKAMLCDKAFDDMCAGEPQRGEQQSDKQQQGEPHDGEPERRTLDRRSGDRRSGDRRVGDRRAAQCHMDECLIMERRVMDRRVTQRRVADRRAGDRRFEDRRIDDGGADEMQAAQTVIAEGAVHSDD